MLPDSWADALFARLTLRYGAAFGRLYADLDPALVRADWARVLDGCSGEALSYALDNLPPAPPNAMQFRDLCRRWQGRPTAALPAPVEQADPQRVQRALRSMVESRASVPDRSLAQQCVDNIERIVAERGGKISSAQRHMVAHCLRMPGTSTKLPVQRTPSQAEEAFT